jgi:hypothetical protein
MFPRKLKNAVTHKVNETLAAGKAGGETPC